jgi:hypothetical protein
MRKLLIIGGAVIGGALLARRCAGHCAHFDFEQMIERMPESAPPKWMFRNISAIRENTDRMLELLEEERTSGTGEHVPTAA